MRNLALLKNTNVDGADGYLLQAMSEVPGLWIKLAFERGGPQSTPAGLHRNSIVVHGSTQPGAVISRLVPIYRMYKMVRRHIQKNEKFNIIVVASTELAILAHLLGLKANRYFCLTADLSEYHRNPSFRYFLGLFERSRVSAGWSHLVTSPGFYGAYFAALKIPKEAINFVFNVDRRVHWEQTEKNLFVPNEIKIVWNGRIRCTASVGILIKSVRMLSRKLSVSIFGTLTSAVEQRLADNAHCGLDYHGRYEPSDLPIVCSSGSLLWACDWALGVNSEALLPNRLFQAIQSGRPLIVSNNTFLATVVQAYEIGIVIDPSAESLSSQLCAMKRADFDTWCYNMRKLAAVIAEQSDTWLDALNCKGKVLTDAMLRGKIFD
jgi:glycosyltransferase involved in cell wall biosynthesis